MAKAAPIRFDGLDYSIARRERKSYRAIRLPLMFGLKEETIRTYIREGSLNAYRFGNVLRVRVDDFEKFVQERRIRRDEDR